MIVNYNQILENIKIKNISNDAIKRAMRDSAIQTLEITLKRVNPVGVDKQIILEMITSLKSEL